MLTGHLRSCARLVGSSLAVCLVLAVPRVARAGESLRAGIAAVEEAEFERALAALDRAETSDTLSREELVTLYERRALVRFALGDAAGADQDLTRLAALEPNLVLDGRTPPQLRAAFERARAALGGRMELALRVVRRGGEAVIRAEVSRAPEGLVQRIEISYRVGAGGAWQSSAGDSVRVALREDEELLVHAAVRGAGGAVIVSEGSAEAPRRFAGTAAGAVIAASSAGPVTAGDDTALHWGIGLGAGGAVMIAVAIAVGVAVSSAPSDQTAFGGPTLRP